MELETLDLITLFLYLLYGLLHFVLAFATARYGILLFPVVLHDNSHGIVKTLQIYKKIRKKHGGFFDPLIFNSSLFLGLTMPAAAYFVHGKIINPYYSIFYAAIGTIVLLAIFALKPEYLESTLKQLIDKAINKIDKKPKVNIDDKKSHEKIEKDLQELLISELQQQNKDSEEDEDEG